MPKIRKENIENINKILAPYKKNKGKYKDYSMGGGETLRVHAPQNPLEAIVGGKINWRKK